MQASDDIDKSRGVATAKSFASINQNVSPSPVDLATETDPLLVKKDQASIDDPNEAVSVKVPRFETLKNVITAVCLWLGYLIVSAAYSLLAPFLPLEAAAKGTSSTMVGVIMSVSPLCVVILSPLFGYFLPRMGIRFTILAGLWLVGGPFILLGFMASPQIDSAPLFVSFCVLLRVTEGVGSAMFYTAAFALIPEMFPNNVGTAMGLFEVAAGLGYSIGPPLGGLLYEAGGFSLPFQVMGSITLLFLIPSFLLVKNFDCQAQTLSWKVMRKLTTNVKIYLLALVNIVSMGAIAFLSPTFQPFLSLNFNLSPLYVGLVFLSGPFSYMIFAVLAGPLSDKLGSRIFIIFGLLVYCAGYIFIGPVHFVSSPKLWITVTAYFVVGLGAAFAMVPIFADLLHIAKESMGDADSEALTGVLSGIISSTVSLGDAAGPLVSGGLSEYLDFQTNTLLFGEVVFALTLVLIGVTVIDKVLNQTNKQKHIN